MLEKMVFIYEDVRFKFDSVDAMIIVSKEIPDSEFKHISKKKMELTTSKFGAKFVMQKMKELNMAHQYK